MFDFNVQTGGRTDFVDITSQVQQALAKLDAVDGAVLVFVNEGADPDVVRDIDMELGKVVPLQDGYHHAEGNSAAHIKSTLVGCTEIVPVSGGRLVLGTWQKIWFCEFDGPRRRRVIVQQL
jgi:secondary thiamine-phosphate synthase enzyme